MEIIREIGSGAFGKVFLAKHQEDPRSLKVVKVCDPEHAEVLQQEITILSQLHHPNIVKFHSKLRIPLKGMEENLYSISMVTEYVSGPDIFSYMTTRVHQSIVKEVILQISDALIYLEYAGIVHRDIKPENIVGSPLGYKLIDFGLAIDLYNPNKVNSCVGTPFYFAPEIVEGEYSPSTDLWAFGVTIYDILTGTRPFASMTLELFRNKENYYHWRRTGKNHFDTIFRKIFIFDPQKRMTAKSLKSYAEEKL